MFSRNVYDKKNDPLPKVHLSDKQATDRVKVSEYSDVTLSPDYL